MNLCLYIKIPFLLRNHKASFQMNGFSKGILAGTKDVVGVLPIRGEKIT